MIIKTYFEKNNTLIYNSLTNTGRNPVTELYYGGLSSSKEYTRYIFKFDETKLRDLYSDKTFSDLSKLKHTLRMTNTSAFETNLLGAETGTGKIRASSFDLILFKIDQEWDEGCGYDYKGFDFVAGTGNLSTSPSNWIDAKTNEPWSGGNGTYSGSPSGITITTQHFDFGNENIEMDITDAVNDIITGQTNYGFGIAFPRSLEESLINSFKSVGFYTRHTQTFYEPHIETNYDVTINDDRGEFYLDKLNKLFLYVNLKGQPTNLDNLPEVLIYDDSDNLFSAITAVIQVTKGVYCVELEVPSSGYTDCSMFRDVWTNISINGKSLNDIELEFTLKDANEYYNIGTNEYLPKDYSYSVHGIIRDERIKRGDIRKVLVSVRTPYTVEQKEIVDNIEYRLFVKEGKAEYTVIDYQPIHQTFNHNYFLLDTDSLLPNTYYLDLKITSNQEISTIKEILSFDIVSQSDLK
jgi:hypothetical protein